MKKLITIAVIIAILTPCIGIAKSRIPMPKVKVVSEKRFTKKVVSKRKGKNILLIEKIKGRVVDAGKHGRTSEGHYISYTMVEDAKKGDTVITYCIFNPENNYVDDVIYRYDFVLK